MGSFRKKPVIVEAIQFIGDIAQIESFVGKKLSHGRSYDTKYVYIKTLEGEMKALEGDWIIKGVNGEFYPCKPDIFEKTYESVEPRDKNKCNLGGPCPHVENEICSSNEDCEFKC